MATINLGRIKPVFRGAYSGGTAYVVDDIVTSAGNTYICIQAHGAGTQAVTVTAYWSPLATKGTDGTDVGTTITTQGDVLYRDGSGLQRLAAGTAGQFLKTQGAGANPVWAGSGLAMQSVVTAATLTAVAGRVYPINTTSNACAITLPASASVGDELKFIDYARNWGTNSVSLDPQSLNFQSGSLVNPVYNTDGQSVTIIYVDATQGWIPTVDDNVTYESALTCRYLVVAGGGASGSDNAGGAGAGGVRGGADDANGKFDIVASTTYTATVGAGGTGTGAATHTNGATSSIAGSGLSTISATGGGRGGSGTDVNANAGGSGGGGGQSPTTAGAGNAGGYDPVEGLGGGTSNHAQSGGQGGGGWGGIGASSNGSSGQASVGHGGIAKTSDITNATVWYAGGGGGGTNQSNEDYHGNGGGTTTSAEQGGGGDGGAASGKGEAGTANTGGGAGGSSQNWSGASTAAGGSGVVIVRLPTSILASSTGSPTSATVGNDTVLSFTGTGTFVTTAF